MLGFLHAYSTGWVLRSCCCSGWLTSGYRTRSRMGGRDQTMCIFSKLDKSGSHFSLRLITATAQGKLSVRSAIDLNGFVGDADVAKFKIRPRMTRDLPERVLEGSDLNLQSYFRARYTLR